MTTTLTVDHPDLDGDFLQVGGLSELVGVCTVTVRPRGHPRPAPRAKELRTD